MILTFRPLTAPPPTWKPANAGRPSSPFSATYEKTLELLDRELDALGATDAHLQVMTDGRGLRLDGQLRADAKVEHPGVILTLETKKRGTLLFSTDRFESPSYKSGPSWQANLRAIALGLEALRTVERYGIAETGQQYAGYRELGSGPALEHIMTPETAARLLAEYGLEEPDAWVDVLADPQVAYRLAVKKYHPDVEGTGDAALFRRLGSAREIIERTRAAR